MSCFRLLFDSVIVRVLSDLTYIYFPLLEAERIGLWLENGSRCTLYPLSKDGVAFIVVKFVITDDWIPKALMKASFDFHHSNSHSS